MIEPEIKIEVMSTSDSEAAAWEAARDIVADCFLYLLQEKVSETDGTGNNDVPD